MPELSPLIPLLIPIVGAVGIQLTGRWENVREGVTMVTALALLLSVALGIAPSVLDPAVANPRWEGPTLVGGLQFLFVVEPLGLLYALVGAVLWIPNSVYSIGYMRGHHEQKQTRFYTCFALALASVMGIAFSGNLFTLFVFYEALSVVTFPLVTHHGSPEARKSGRIYVGILFGTSMLFFLFAIVGTYQLAGRMDFLPGGILESVGRGDQGLLFLLFMLGIGKAALMPFHFWLPAAMVAPTPVSALLHAVAVVKAGVFCVLKVSVYVFGTELVASPATGNWLIYAASFTVVVASLVALYQDNLKRRLAYSTVGQLGYIVLGAALGTKLAIIGGGMHIVMHAFGKITLFFCAGAIYVATGKTKVSQLVGMGRQMPVTFLAFGVASLSIIGLPPLGGAWSKWYLGLGSLASTHPSVVFVFLLSSILNVAYLLPIAIRAFYLPPEDGRERGFSEAPWPCVAALSFTAAGSVALFFFPEPLYRLMQTVVAT